MLSSTLSILDDQIAADMSGLMAAYGKFADLPQLTADMVCENMEAYQTDESYGGDNRIKGYAQPYLDHCYASELPGLGDGGSGGMGEPLNSLSDLDEASPHANTALLTNVLRMQQQQQLKSQQPQLLRQLQQQQQMQHHQQQLQLQLQQQQRQQLQGQQQQLHVQQQLQQQRHQQLQEQQQLRQQQIQQRQQELQRQRLLQQQQRQQQQQHQRQQLMERERKKKEEEEDDDQWAGSVTRCICDFQHDDGYMICCDRCGVWQHVVCMGLDKNNIPEMYLCELCNPRLVDKRRAIRIQTQKKEELESEETDSDSEGGRLVIGGRRGGGGGRGEGSRRGRKRGEGAGGGRGGKRSRTFSREDSGNESFGPPGGRGRGRPTSVLVHKPLGNSPALVGRRGGRLQSPGGHEAAGSSSGHQLSFGLLPDPSRPAAVPSSSQQHSNNYSNEVLKLLVAKRGEGVTGDRVGGLLTEASSGVNPEQLKEQTCRRRFKVSLFDDDEAKGLEAIESIRINQAVAEYTGSVMLRQEYERDRQCDMSFPFVLCYAGLDSGVEGAEVCIDASVSSNDARYVRCSCTPNAKVLHILDQNSIRFYICATKNIQEGREVTIPFYFDYRKGACEVKCACGRPACPVMRFFSNRTTPARSTTPSGGGARAHKRKSVESPSGPAQMSSPAAVSGETSGNNNNNASVQRRRKSRASELLHGDLGVSHDLSDDITLINRLMGGDRDTNHTPAGGGRGLRGERNKPQDSGEGKGSAIAQSRVALTNAIEKNATTTSQAQQEQRKSREQKKIEAVERAFEKINAREVAKKEKDSTSGSTTVNKKQPTPPAPTPTNRGKINHTSVAATQQKTPAAAAGAAARGRAGSINNKPANKGSPLSNGGDDSLINRSLYRAAKGLRSLEH